MKTGKKKNVTVTGVKLRPWMYLRTGCRTNSILAEIQKRFHIEEFEQLPKVVSYS